MIVGLLLGVLYVTRTLEKHYEFGAALESGCTFSLSKAYPPKVRRTADVMMARFAETGRFAEIEVFVPRSWTAETPVVYFTVSNCSRKVLDRVDWAPLSGFRFRVRPREAGISQLFENRMPFLGATNLPPAEWSQWHDLHPGECFEIAVVFPRGVVRAPAVLDVTWDSCGPWSLDKWGDVRTETNDHIQIFDIPVEDRGRSFGFKN